MAAVRRKVQTPPPFHPLPATIIASIFSLLNYRDFIEALRTHRNIHTILSNSLLAWRILGAAYRPRISALYYYPNPKAAAHFNPRLSLPEIQSLIKKDVITRRAVIRQYDHHTELADFYPVMQTLWSKDMDSARTLGLVLAPPHNIPLAAANRTHFKEGDLKAFEEKSPLRLLQTELGHSNPYSPAESRTSRCFCYSTHSFSSPLAALNQPGTHDLRHAIYHTIRILSSDPETQASTASSLYQGRPLVTWASLLAQDVGMWLTPAQLTNTCHHSSTIYLHRSYTVVPSHNSKNFFITIAVSVGNEPVVQNWLSQLTAPYDSATQDILYMCLIAAARYGHARLFTLLMESGAEILDDDDEDDFFDDDRLFRTIIEGHDTNILSAYLNKTRINLIPENQHKKSRLFELSCSGDFRLFMMGIEHQRKMHGETTPEILTEILRLLLIHYPHYDYPFSPLIYFSRFFYSTPWSFTPNVIIDFLLKNHAVLSTDKIFLTRTLHKLAKSPYHDGTTEVARYLITHNAELVLPKNVEESALHCAATAANLPLVRLLLDNKADVNMQTNKLKLTALHCAQGAPVTRALIAAKADPSLKTKDGLQAATCAFTEMDFDKIEALKEISLHPDKTTGLVGLLQRETLLKDDAPACPEILDTIGLTLENITTSVPNLDTRDEYEAENDKETDEEEKPMSAYEIAFKTLSSNIRSYEIVQRLFRLGGYFMPQEEMIEEMHSNEYKFLVALHLDQCSREGKWFAPHKAFQCTGVVVRDRNYGGKIVSQLSKHSLFNKIEKDLSHVKKRISDEGKGRDNTVIQPYSIVQLFLNMTIRACHLMERAKAKPLEKSIAFSLAVISYIYPKGRKAYDHYCNTEEEEEKEADRPIRKPTAAAP